MLEFKTRFYREPIPRVEPDGAARLLIIEHERRSGLALAFMLAARGYTDVRTVRSPARALAVAKQFSPQIIFLDLELPDDGSLELAQQLKRDGRGSPSRLIALTADAEHPRREQARLAGFERFLTKPVEQEELDKILGKQLS
jgi:CheY-like chemotaxis protein